MNHAMLDLETLSTRNDACILSIGVAIFNDTEVIDSEGWAIHSKFWHGHVDMDTLAWWLHPDRDAARDFSFQGKLEDFTVAFQLKTFLARHNVVEYWANSPQFDVVILQSWWKRLKDVGEFPIHYRMPRDMRTLVAEAERLGHDPKSFAGTYVAHNPVDDAVSQARVVIAARKLIGSASPANGGHA
jgi:hypothetical protein